MSKLASRLASLIQQRLGSGNSNFLLLLFANGLSNFVQFVCSMLLARQLEPSEFGVFSFFVGFAQSLSLCIDLGLCATLVRLAAGQDNRMNRVTMLGVTASFQALVYVALFCVVWLKSTYILSFFEQQGREPFLLLALVMAGVIAIQLLLKSVTQIARDIKHLALFTLLYAVTRAVFFAYVMFIGEGSLSHFFVALYLAPLLVSCGIYAIILALVDARVKDEVPINRLRHANAVQWRQCAVELFHYGKWMIAQPLYSLLYLVPVFMLARSSAHELGVYSAAFTFAAVFSLINTSIRQITLPIVSRFQNQQDIKQYFRQIQRKLAFAIAACALLVIAMSFLLGIVLGAKYAESTLVFCVLGSGMAITIIIGQFNMISHVFRRPDLLLKMTVSELLIIIVCCYLFIFRWDFGAIGAAIATAGTILGGELWLVRKLQTIRRNWQPA